MNRVLSSRGFEPHPPDAYRHFVGDGVIALVERALPAGARSRAEVAATVAAMRAEYARSWAVRTRPYPGIAELLDASTARGLRLAVLSNKPHEFTAAMVAHFLGRWSFGAVEGLREGGPRKPDSAGALAIARSLGVTPEGCCFVGDSQVDMEAARRAGMIAVGVGWGFRDEAELVTAGAHHVIRAPMELLSLL
jgi:phosphoglycolate phosphatase